MSNDKGAQIYLFHQSGVTPDDSPLSRFGATGLLLPVAPLTDIQINENVVVNNDTLPRTGAVVYGGGAGATTVSVATEFPVEANSYVQAGHGHPSEYHRYIKLLSQNNICFRLLISHAGNISVLGGDPARDFIVFDDLVLIQQFTSVHGDGYDIGVNIEFVKWQKVNIRKYEEKGYNGPWADRNAKNLRPGQKKRPTTATVKKGVTIEDIAQKYYDSVKAVSFILANPKNKKYKRNKKNLKITAKKKSHSVWLPNVSWNRKLYDKVVGS